MNPDNPDLAAAKTGESSASSLSALAQAVALLDAQLGAITYPATSDPALDQMVVALQRMQNAAGGWPPTKAAVLAAAQEAVPLGELAGQLDGAGPDADALAAEVRQFVQGPLHSLVQVFAAAEDALNAFDAQMTAAYAQGATANTAAQEYLSGEQIKCQNAADDLRARIDDLQSPSGIAAGVFSLGIYDVVELTNLKEEVDAFGEREQRLNELQQAYQELLQVWSQALEMTRQSAYAVDLLNTALQQLANAAGDIDPITSSNLIVMQAVVQTLQAECQALAGAARELASLGE